MSSTAKAPLTIRGHNCFSMDNRTQGYQTTQGYDLATLISLVFLRDLTGGQYNFFDLFKANQKTTQLIESPIQKFARLSNP